MIDPLIISLGVNFVSLLLIGYLGYRHRQRVSELERHQRLETATHLSTLARKDQELIMMIREKDEFIKDLENKFFARKPDDYLRVSNKEAGDMVDSVEESEHVDLEDISEDEILDKWEGQEVK